MASIFYFCIFRGSSKKVWSDQIWFTPTLTPLVSGIVILSRFVTARNAWRTGIGCPDKGKFHTVLARIIINYCSITTDF
jgi:hypothetical protein